MRKRILDNLYVGDLTDCAACRGQDGWAIVHACKHPCHAEHAEKQHGAKQLKPDHPAYFAERVDWNLYLNIIDPPTPLFQRIVFERFLEFMRVAWQQGLKVLIHCNKGESRAPTLALLFIAKALYQINHRSYDDAWDDFEQLIGQPYRPGKGIEDWMRQHWDELDGGNKLPSIRGLVPDAAEQQADRVAQAMMEIPDDPELAAGIVRTQPLIHFAGFTQICDKENTWIDPTPNKLQFDIAEAYEWCRERKLPCRLIILKPRQVGCSTFCAQLCYHHMRAYPSNMLIMGDVAKRTEKVFSMFCHIPEHDAFDWESSFTYNTERAKFIFPDGRECLVEPDTALDPKAGISATRQVLWMTEAARYLKTNGRDKKVVTAVLNSLANVPNSLGIAESTAEGASGWFYETWQGASTLEERKNGAIGNGWIRVFAAWFEFPEYQLKRTDDNADYFADELDARERRGISLYGWTMEQIAWRRKAKKENCANDDRMFDQDYPEDAQSCFLASGRPKFDQEALAAMEQYAKVHHGLAERGVLERDDRGQLRFIDRGPAENWLWVADRPTPGRAYIAFIDPCTGEQSEGSLFPDSHAPGIIQRGYKGDRGEIHNAKLAAAIDVPNGCHWDDPVVAERIALLAEWYGGCMVVPETGNGLGVLNELRRQPGVNIYRRRKHDNVNPGKMLDVIGWETNRETRPLVVNAVTKYVNDRAFDCGYLPMIEQLKAFIVTDRGRAEAKSGCHDDWVMGPGLGLVNIEFASIMPPPRFDFSVPDGFRSDVPRTLKVGAMS